MRGRDHVSVFVASGLLVAAYAVGIYGYQRFSRASGEASSLAAGASGGSARDDDGSADAVDAAEQAEYYEITTESGSVHVERMADRDPAGVLMFVTQKYGARATLRHLSGPQGRARQLASSSLIERLPVLFVFPLGLLLAGLRTRRRNREIERVWERVRPLLTLDAAPLMSELSITARRLEQILVALQRRGRAQLVWNAETGRIYDERLSMYSHALPFCPRCNAPSNLRVRADLNELPACEACFSPCDRAQLEPLTRSIAVRLQNEPVARMDEDAPRFALGWFVLWTCLFPPIAIAHALRTAE